MAGALSEVLSSVSGMAGSATPLAERRQIIAAGREATRDLHTVGYQCPSDQLGELVGELAELAALSMGQLAAVVADAEARGVVEASQRDTHHDRNKEEMTERHPPSGQEADQRHRHRAGEQQLTGKHRAEPTAA